jgi:heptosyltransferase II
MQRILIVAPAWVGDCVMTHGLLMLLKAQYPAAIIDVFASSGVAAVYRRMPEISSIIDNPFAHGALRFKARRACGKALAANHYDLAIVLPNSFKSALVPWFANIKNSRGFRGEKRGWILQDCRNLDEIALPTMAARFAALAFATGENTSNYTIPNPHLHIANHAVSPILARLAINLDSPVIALCPGAEYGPAKRWPAAHFAQLAKLQAARGHKVWIFGGKNDRAIGDEINQLSGGICCNLAGETSLDDAIDLLSCVSHVITNDSGLMHVACALNVPVSALYGSSSPRFTPPLSPTAQVLSLNLLCSPCFKRECPLGHFDCLNKLDAATVNHTIASPLAAPSRSLRNPDH